jgi:PKD repeat protein
MKKFAFLILLVLGTLAWLVCNPVSPVSVKSVEITPAGDTVRTTLTAKIEVLGKGKVTVKWFNAAYDTVHLARTDQIEVDSSGSYTSVFSSDLGWYWIDILNEEDSLLWHTDSVFCGPDSLLPVVKFTVDQDAGPHPLTVTFTNTTKKDSYTKWLWYFGDGSTSTDWSPVHTYTNPGDFKVILKVYNLAGSSSDSVMIHVHEPLSVNAVGITPPGSISKTTLVANIDVEGEGKIRVQWWNAVYDTVSLAWTDEIEVDSSGSYASVFSSDLGWYWIDIVNENDSRLWHTDSVFCGPDSSLPKVEFYPDWYYGPHPIRVTFYIKTKKDQYTNAFWDFRDGATSTEWEPAHTFEDPGQFQVVLKIYNLAGSSLDSTLIFVW